MVDFSEKKRKSQKNFVKKEIPHPSFLNALQDHHDEGPVVF